MFSDFSIISLVIAALFGALVNNVFTLKVKSRIEAVNDLYGDLCQLHKLFLTFLNKCDKRLKENHRLIRISFNSGIKPPENDKLREINNEIKQIQDHANSIVTEMKPHYQISLDRTFANIASYTNQVQYALNSKNAYKKYLPEVNDLNQNPSPTKAFKEIATIHEKSLIELKEYRKELTSMPYLLTEIGYEIANTIGWIVFSKLTFIGITLFLH